jgi:hypothetical protein
MLNTILDVDASDSRRARRLRMFLFVLPFLIVAAFVTVKFLRPSYYFRFATHEDSLFEYLTALSYLVASFFFLRSWRASGFLDNRLVSIGFLAAGILFFLIFGEEISWGQRILSVATPEGIAEANRQGELTFHNLNAVYRYNLYGALSVSSLGAFGWIIFAVLPSRARERLTAIGMRRFIPDWFLSSYFFVLFAVYSGMTYLQGPLISLFGEAARKGGPYLVSGDQEPAEAIFALGVMLFAYVSYSRLKRESSEELPAEETEPRGS